MYIILDSKKKSLFKYIDITTNFNKNYLSQKNWKEWITYLR